MLRRISAAMAGAASAMWPLLVLAEGGDASAVSRAVAAPHSAGSVMLIALLALLGVFGVGALGYAYRRQRNLDWAFQRPDAPHDEHH